MVQQTELSPKLALERALTRLLGTIHATGDCANTKIRIMTEAILYCLNDIYYSIANPGKPFPPFNEDQFAESKISLHTGFFLDQLLHRAKTA